MTIRVYLAGIIALAGTPCAFAQVDTYPNKAIRWVIPFQPGGGTDMVARPVAAKLTDRIGQQILYDNRGGGGGGSGGETLANAKPGGYTLLGGGLAGGTRPRTLAKTPVVP